MNLKIDFKNQNYNGNCVLFYDNFSNFKKLASKLKIIDIENLIRSIDNKIIDKYKFQVLNIKNNQKIIVIKLQIGEIPSKNEKVGAKIIDCVKKNYVEELNFIYENLSNYIEKDKFFLNSIILGAKTRSYKFNKYKTNYESQKFRFILPTAMRKSFYHHDIKFKAIYEGIEITKDLVSEPGNILHPEEYVKRISFLKKYGLKIKIYNEKELKKLGMNALLGVGQGSIRQSYLVSIEWRGSEKKIKPLAFVGKGVCFDTGGISLKPAKFMEDMTYDMAGSAVVVGLMKTLALRKAKVNAVGVVGLVENMPDGNAQRPGDIVKSYSGKTIEILNTDAEGRLVLADALTYTEKKFKPKFIVDLATLTGAIIVSLGSEYAGLFSNDDKISDQLSKAGEKVGEKVWRMPLNNNYDKLIDSKKADMQNINYVGGAGSTTAAQFLQRFILNKTPWAHLDIAGMAFSKYGGALNSGGATGYGVRLLNQLIEDNYE
jgi:leucyl aminopeptidase